MSSSANNVSIVDASVATALIAPDPSRKSAKEDSTNDNIKNYNNNDNDNDSKNAAAAAATTTTTTAGGTGTVEESKKEKSSSVVVSADERFYAVDPTRLQTLRDEKPWTKVAEPDPSTTSSSSSSSRPVAKFFESISLSPSAVTKIMMHCQSGVEKGVAQGGNPIEVMGLMLGRPDPFKPTNLIVTDAFPLPIEGFETRVIADDQSVINHMISLGERLEGTRKEKFMGWYHSHPFDLVVGEESRSHCFLSQTDLSTQLQWQRAEDPHGNPFAAIVVDPLRSMHLGTPQLKAFRAYPPEYQSKIANECPDGSIITSERVRLERWGSCWNRYYEMNVEYYMSDASRSILGDLTQNYLWMKSFRRDGQDGDGGDGSGGGGGGAGGSESVKVSTLREIATDARTAIGSSASNMIGGGGGGVGGTGGTFPISKASAIEPVVQKLRTAATKALTKQTARCVHAKVFSPPNQNINVDADVVAPAAQTENKTGN